MPNSLVKLYAQLEYHRIHPLFFQSMKSESKAIAFGLGAVLSWSTVATAFKLALGHQSVTQLLFTATLTSCLFLAGLLSLKKELGIALRAIPQNWQIALVCGCLNPLLYYLVLLHAYQLLPAQVAQPINYTWAIVLAFMAVPFLGQTLRRNDIIALIICYTGVVIISSGASDNGQNATVLGVSLALISTVIWASYWIINSRDQRAPSVALFQNFLFALPIATTLAFIGPLTWSMPAIAAGIYVGIFEMGLAFVLWLQAMKATSNTSRLSNLIFLSPFISLVFIYVILGESIHTLTFVGLAFIISGIYIQNQRKTN